MSVVGRPSPHESAHLHVTGAARYVADDPGPPGTLFVVPVGSTVARGRIVRLDVAPACSLPGVHAVLTIDDIPGDRLWGPIRHDEPLLADGEVHYQGQAIALVVAETEAQAWAAARAVVVEIDVEAPVLTIDEAIARNAFHTEPHTISRGDLTGAFARADLVISGEERIPGQDHFYLETQAALATLGEDRTVHVSSSTQHPTEVQHVVANALGISNHRVVVAVPRMGGGFGGKESQASPYAAYAALGAWVTGRPCRCWLHREQDMAWTGKRHPFLARWRAAFASDGRFLGFDISLWSNGGWTVDLSGPVMDRALFHVDGAYHIEALRTTGRVCATNLPSNTAFRGFGGPQGAVAIEAAIDAAAVWLGLDPTHIRTMNLYGDAPRNETHFGQIIEQNQLPRLARTLQESADLEARQAEIRRFNATSRWRKRGLAFQPVKFGISFTASLLNQAGALVLVYTDGTVQVNHGGTEMGQGLHTKIRAVAADAFGIERDAVRIMTTQTDKVPNTSATAASSGSDLNGAAVARACQAIVERMRAVAADTLDGTDPATFVFANGRVSIPGGPSMAFGELARSCWAQQVSLSSTGYYATPGITYDPAIGRGRPFFYFAFGGAISEVEVCGLTGEYRVLRIDILHDVGDSLVPTIDRGQIEGGFVQGMGWLTTEELQFDSAGRLLTHGPSTYKIPSAGDVPTDFRVDLLRNATNDKVIRGSKAVGEPPFVLALSVPGALRAAIAAFQSDAHPPFLTLPATPEAVLRAIERIDDAESAEERRVS
ncbi:MAG TPA: xanthine dehydrogenase molybdopterin binding subunit [Deltaproteobacteria bacterium]|nr:xanthine dehydrogenase molybdopterin binding subunit [Deltaproteobacteria bacterium]